MESPVNCHTIGVDGTLEAGIPVQRISRRESVVKVGHIAVPLLMNHSNKAMPFVIEGRVVQAQPARPQERCALVGLGALRCVLVYVASHHLRFDDRFAEKLPVSNAWPGIETEYEAFVQVGRRSSREQYQLVVIPNGSAAIVADTQSRYMTLTCIGTTVIRSTTSAEELGRCLVRRAERRLHQHSPLLWTLKTLQALHVEDLWTAQLRERLQRLDVRVPSRSGS